MPLFLILLCSLIGFQSYGQTSFIAGRVYNQSNKALLKNAKLILRKNNKYIGKIRTDHAGHYWFGNLKPGNYSLWVLQDGFCQLEMGRIEIADSGIQLDLGLMESAPNSKVNKSSKVYLIYQEPIYVNLDEPTTAYQGFQNEIHILNEVYDGHAIRIAPKHIPPSPMEQNRATHFYETLNALQKSNNGL